MNSSPTGTLIVISGPSGVGKSTVVRRLLQICDVPLTLSVSATTRKPRAGEIDGVDYYFMTQEEFEAKRKADEFLEFAEVFGRDEWYGTLELPVRESLASGKSVILEIDVQGALMVLKRFPDALTVFIHPGSIEELEKRLRGRDTEKEEQIKRRLAVAQTELEMTSNYNYIVHNKDIDSTAKQICRLLANIGDEKTCTKN